MSRALPVVVVAALLAAGGWWMSQSPTTSPEPAVKSPAALVEAAKTKEAQKKAKAPKATADMFPPKAEFLVDPKNPPTGGMVRPETKATAAQNEAATTIVGEIVAQGTDQIRATMRVMRTKDGLPPSTEVEDALTDYEGTLARIDHELTRRKLAPTDAYQQLQKARESLVLKMESGLGAELAPKTLAEMGTMAPLPAAHPNPPDVDLSGFGGKPLEGWAPKQ